jgi:hypothetical protein
MWHTQFSLRHILDHDLLRILAEFHKINSSYLEEIKKKYITFLLGKV